MKKIFEAVLQFFGSLAPKKQTGTNMEAGASFGGKLETKLIRKKDKEKQK